VGGGPGDYEHQCAQSEREQESEQLRQPRGIAYMVRELTGGIDKRRGNCVDDGRARCADDDRPGTVGSGRNDPALAQATQRAQARDHGQEEAQAAASHRNEANPTAGRTKM
jgi:hypothetical protein